MKEYCKFFKEFLNDVDYVLDIIEQSDRSDFEKSFLAKIQTQNILTSFINNKILPQSTLLFLSYKDGNFSYWFDELTENLLAEYCDEEDL